MLILLACTAPVDTGTDLTVWSGTVSLDRTTTIPNGEVLQIEPGTQVLMGPGVSLVIGGTLDARGTEAEPIVFGRLDPDEAWAGVVFNRPSTPATFTDLDRFEAGSILAYAELSGATRALALDGASPYLHALRVHDNTLPTGLDPLGGAGLLIMDGSTARVRDCVFTHNTAELFAFGGAVNVIAANPILQDNHFENNWSSYGGAVATESSASPIVGNTFIGNDTASEGGALSLVSSVSAVLHNTVTANNARGDGGGIHVCVTCYPHAAPTLLGNTVTDNSSQSDHADESAGGIGAAYLRGMADNTVHGNTRDGEPSDFGWFHALVDGYPEWVASPSIGENYWGTTDTELIGAAVFDGQDDPDFGIVDLQPVLEAPPVLDGPRVVVALGKLSVGEDELVPVYLTVYNPGAETQLTLTLTHAENGVAAPFEGDIGFPGAQRLEDGVWSLHMPAEGVWFSEFSTVSWDGGEAIDGAWTATLSQQDEVVGRPSVGRYATE